MIYITGDTHGDFQRIKEFCNRMDTAKDDIMIILGDVGANFSGFHQDMKSKKLLESLPITIFGIHGNHEMRPQTLPSYREKFWHGGVVFVEEDFPSLLFAKDGEIFDFYGTKAIVIGGAYSIDKYYRLAYGYGWWADEQPSDEIKAYVESQLDFIDWKVDVVLSHTAPRKYEPIEVFMEGIDQSKIDKSTEDWLDMIEDRLEYKKWYCGHFHTDKKIDRFEIMFENVDMFYCDNGVYGADDFH